MTVILDGGLSTELEAAGHDLADRLWTARLLLTDPAAIEAVHLAYFRAGAQVATTASYQATVPGFVAAGYTADEALGAIRRSVELARSARDRYAAETGADPAALLVAGSVGPYAAMLGDGSEYRGDKDPGTAALRDLHGPRMETLVDAGVDLLAIETIPSLREARVVVDLLDGLGATGWLSYQCRDGGRTAAGDPIADAMAVAAGSPGLVAVGVNCTAPRHVPQLLAASAGAVPDLPRAIYPNAGDRWDGVTRRWVADAGGGYDPATVASWAADGSTWVGGCCGTGPAEIERLSRALAA